MSDIITQTFFVAHRAKSMNYYNSAHYMVRNKDKNKFKVYVEEAIEKYNIQPISEEYVVNFIWQPVLCKVGHAKSYDMVNYSSSIKMIEDWLVKLGILVNDDSRYVVSHQTNRTIEQKTHDTGFIVIMEAVKTTASEIDKAYLNML